jgi:serine/threonine protein kinase
MDLFVPLARRDGESAADWGLRLLGDLAASHRRAARVHVETYLERLPGLAAEAEVVLDLLVAEWTLRRQAGEAVELAEYVRRFPAWEKELRMLWEVDHQTPPADEPATAARLPDWYVGSAALPVAFGEFRLLRELGGGMARVFLTEPLAGGDGAVLKVPKLPLGQDAEAVAERASCQKRFLREAHLTRKLDHPSLCRALDVGECDGLPYFTMPYYPGGSVSQDLQAHGPFDQRAAARLIADVARALQHAHDLGIIHRDLKPSNLLRNEQGQVVVTDLGLAFPLDGEGPRLTRTGNIPGTPLYFSPEQASGECNLTPASDIFSLGVVLYELLTGQQPFKGNVIDLLRAIQEAWPTPLEDLRPEVSPVLATICRKAMSREPSHRYHSMTAFADDLERFLAGTWAPQRLTPTEIDLTVSRPWWGRSWRAAAFSVGVAILLGCVVALGVFVGSNGTQPPPEGRTVVSTRQPIGLRGQLQLMHDDLDKLEAVIRPHVRYLSLLAVHDNPYVDDADLALHLDALRRVLNRLSHNKLNVPVYLVDASGCLLRIDLRDLDWHPAIEWELLLQAEPYGVRFDAVNPDESVRKLARETYALAGINSLFDAPGVRADWLIVATTRTPLYGRLQQTDDKERSSPPFDLTDSNEPITRVVKLYQGNSVDARVAAAELGLGTVAELDARWPADKRDLRNDLYQSLPRRRWAGEDGNALFADHVRALKLGVPRATQPLR